MDGYTASDVEDGADGNTMKEDLESALALLVPEVVEETFGSGGGGGRRGRGRRMMLRTVKEEKRMDDRQQKWTEDRRRRRLAVEYTGETPPTVDELTDIGTFF